MGGLGGRQFKKLWVGTGVWTPEGSIAFNKNCRRSARNFYIARLEFLSCLQNLESPTFLTTPFPFMEDRKILTVRQKNISGACVGVYNINNTTRVRVRLEKSKIRTEQITDRPGHR